MLTILDCKCGDKWQIETHDSEGSYRGHLACGTCKRFIVAWEGSYYYTIAKVTGEQDPPKASAAGTAS